ncbi:hypothetical protein RN001_001338 [Aquatica leii]|uniref:Carboxylesterase type B domain-containing protein n=1 Tax=Aquatica leii TaxID=1421715 RepID=A0AAN7Q7T2_9COLE|nr:hypothetical protein RN001_001338 [Aquatica leii]
MSDPIVTVKNGKLRGKLSKNYDGGTFYSFQGIPYAKPPLGSLRFKAPLPAESWDGIRNATRNGNDCITPFVLTESAVNLYTRQSLPSKSSKDDGIKNGDDYTTPSLSYIGSEDCLYLNVYTPLLSNSDKTLKPVMVWFHGGAFAMGSGSSNTEGPEFIMTKNVVLVTLNYRLGLLGFLSFEDTSLEVPGNAGLKDQVLALKWIQENISQFYGNPNNVTIFGVSAGAAAVHYLMLSPITKGLFHKCILQSGCVFSPWAKSHRTLPFLTKALEIDTTNEKQILEILQKMPVEELLELQLKIKEDFEPSHIRCIAPVVENTSSTAFITEEPEQIIISGKYHNVPMIIGFTSKEGIFTDLYCDHSKNDYVVPNFETKISHNAKIAKESKLSKITANKIKQFYYGNHKMCKDNKNQLYLLQGDSIFEWPIMMTVKHHTATSTSPIYLYKFSVDANLNLAKKYIRSDVPGASHGDDTGYLFANSSVPPMIHNSTEEKVMKNIVTLWTNFAIYGIPITTADSLININWQPVNKNILHYLDIGENLTVGINPDEERMKFWEKISYNDISLENIYDLTADTIKELIPSVGKPIKFPKHFFSALAEVSTSTSSFDLESETTNSIDSATTPNITGNDNEINKQSKAEYNLVEYSILQHSFPNFDLATLLSTSPFGLSVLNFYKENNNLDHTRRNRLTDIIIKHIFNHIVKHSRSRLKMSEPIVSITNGKLRGRIAKDYEGIKYFCFQGIPYAKPPLGPLRFKAPLPPDSWSGIRDATENGNDCLCNDLFVTSTGSENCLFLNVYTRELYSKDSILKPVMFWIHGGGFISGSGSSLLYGPQFLITKDVVIVTINYRLGLLGFLNFEDPALEVSGNAGLKDQVMALQWVQKNIKQFCGDPNNVTVFGESAGAASIHYLILSPSAKGLFHKAILQSGCAFSTWAIGQSLYTLIKQALNMNTATENEILKTLENMSDVELLQLQKKMPDDFEASFVRSIAPVVEKISSANPIITQKPEDIILSGNYNHVSFIIGFNSREGIIADVHNKEFKIYGHAIKDFESKIPHNMSIIKQTKVSKNIGAKIQNFYYGTEKPSEENKNQYYLMHGDNAFVWPIIHTATQHLLTSKKPIYLYRLSVESNLNICKNMGKFDNPGVAHADDIAYIFKSILTPKIIPNSIEDISIKRITTLWTNFAKYGNPNPDKNDLLINTNWKPIEYKQLNYLEIGENLTVGVNPDEHRMQLWRNISLVNYNKCKL